MSQDPVRLLDDPSLPDLLREDLAEAANQPLPAVDTAAGLASLQAAIKAGGGATATVKGAALAQGSWWGGALIGLGAGLVGAAAIWLAPPLTPPSPPPSPARIEAPTPPPSAASTTSMVPAPIATSAALPPDRSPLLRAQPSPLAPLPSPSSLGSADTSALVASVAPVDGPAEELELLVQIKQKASSEPAAALSLVEEGHRRFPRGSFYQERESIAVLALAQLGRAAEARERAKHFLDAHPQSPYAERLRRLVAGSAP